MLTAQVFKGNMFRWYVRLVAQNGEILAVSEAYTTKWNAKRAAKKNFPNARLKMIEDMTASNES
jgi:uncharacterized protein YegP (UPF0339 family)